MVNKDLILKLDELTCEKEMLQGELEAVLQARTKLEDKNKELEEELKKLVSSHSRETFLTAVAKMKNNKRT